MTDQAWYRALRNAVVVSAAYLLMATVTWTIVVPRWETLAPWQQVLYWCLSAALLPWAAVALWKLYKIARTRANDRR